MTNTQKIEVLLAWFLYHGSFWFLRVLAFMFTAICVHLFIKWAGLSLPPYF